MSSAMNQDAYGTPGWGSGAGHWNQPSGHAPGGPWAGPWGGHEGAPGHAPAWGPPPFWRGRVFNGPLGIALMVLGFILFWPVGLAILLYMLGSGRMSCNGRRRRDGYQGGDWSSGWGAWKSWACAASSRAAPSSGNRAFDEYRAETLRRLEEEQKEFGAFLDRLRFARDKAEFDQFMAERRNRPTPPSNGNGQGEQPAA
ncbi:MAG TPA: DUF2852 domain-containing protein [Rhodopila sp.]|nr:DUF2852 domain-containing protein [Rhodopila sp.]